MSTKTLRSMAPSSRWAASYLRPSLAAFITTIAESSFQYTQRLRAGIRRATRQQECDEAWTLYARGYWGASAHSRIDTAIAQATTFDRVRASRQHHLPAARTVAPVSRISALTQLYSWRLFIAQPEFRYKPHRPFAGGAGRRGPRATKRSRGLWCGHVRRSAE